MQQLIDIYKIKNMDRPSYDGLAVELLETYKDLDWGATKARSLGVRLGHIDKGNTGWWQKRPALAKALAEFLNVPPEDLGIHPQEAGDLHRFPEFPGLPPLNLGSELPCEIGRPISRREDRRGEEFEPWFGQGPVGIMVRQPASGVHWLHFPPGRGADLFWAHLQRHSKYESRRTNTIHDARDILKQPRHLILRIDADGGDPDLHTLAAMHHDMALLIVAPHAAPLRPNPGDIDTLFLWESYNGPLDARREFDLTAGPFEQIRSFEWCLYPDWITRLVTWIENRMNALQADTHFTAEEMLRWLEQFPFLQHQIKGPGDILHLSSLLHHRPSRNWPKAKNREAGKQLLQHILPTSAGIQNDYRELSLAAWRGETADWGTPQPIESWERLATAQPDSVEKKFKALIDADDRATRAKLARELKSPPSRLNVARLAEQHLLAPEPGEMHSLRPRFMPWLLARDHVIDCMTHQELESWALHCFDPKRRPVVDAALDALTIDQLLPIAEMLPESLTGNAAAIAAAEALFYTIGRRIQREVQALPALLSIAPRVLHQLDLDNAQEIPGPWSRAIVEYAAKTQWIATCWSWSLLPRPESLPASLQNSWLFPGWSNDLNKADHRGLVVSLISDQREHRVEDIQPILQRARDLTERLEKPPAFPPDLLKPFLIAEAAKSRWPIDPAWWTSTLEARWSEQVLVEQLREIPVQLLPSLLSSLLDHVIGASNPKERESIPWKFLVSRVRIAIMNRLPSGTLGNAFSKKQINLLLALPESLPPALRSEALEFLLATHQQEGNCAKKLITLSTESDTPILLDWLQTGQWKAAAQQVWRLAHHQAKSILSNATDEEPQTVRALLLTCPDLSYSLPLMREHSHLFRQQDLKAWVREQLPYAGLHSRDLMELLDAV